MPGRAIGSDRGCGPHPAGEERRRQPDGDGEDEPGAQDDQEHQPEPVVTVKGKVYDRKTQQPISARIFYETLPEGKEVGQIFSDPKTGDYQIILPSGSQYGYLAEAENYLAVNANIDLRDNVDYDEISRDLYLVPVEREATITMNNIFFDFDKHELKEESYPELNRLVTFLERNPKVKILVAGHTDNIGTQEYNNKLSELRSQAVVEYLAAQGIPEDRMENKGFGKSQPIVSNDDETGGRELNRRVEFKILED